MARRAIPGRSSRTTPAMLERGTVQQGDTAIDYEVVRSARRRRTLQLTVDGEGVRVSAPMRTPRDEIEEFVRGRTPWILKHRPTVQPPLAYATGEAIPFEGHALPLYVTERSIRSVTITRGLFELLVTVPGRYEEPRRSRAIANAITKWYTERAQEAVLASVARWVAITGRTPREVVVRNQRQRWGSCSPDGTLRFNWRLIMLDPALLDYVVVHELAHLEVPNHGPSFWAAVTRLLPDHAARRKRMRAAAANLPTL